MSPRLAALLREVGRSGSLRKAARTLGIAPGNAYRLLRNAESRLGAKLTRGSRGGRSGGGSHLTAAGQRVARRRADALGPSLTWWPCRLEEASRNDRPVRVLVPEAGVSVSVAPVVRPWAGVRGRPRGTELELGIAPDAATILPRGSRLSGSARNVWRGRVLAIRAPGAYGVRAVHVAVGTRQLNITVTTAAVDQLRLHRGSEVVLFLKATALRLREPVH